MSSTAETPAITLYTTQTPNGVKISIALEELGLPYTVKKLDLSTGVQKEPWFLAINPNGRMPAITDTSFPDGKAIHVWESGAILQYLVETYDKDHKISYPKGSREDWQVQQWLFFQNTGVGPMQGQANHFFRYAPERIPYATNRYIAETERLYSVLEAQLASSSSGFLVGDRLTIADITTWGWITIAEWSGIDVAKFPALQKWQKLLEQRPALKRGADVPEPSKIKETLKSPEAIEKAQQAATKWIVPK
ncbi:Glutathione S-transferase 2 [Maublancomyces gigas]|uniref:Glutathione S-transferase 2 n=1 Tax=Discina gigas TaxID=1032678 RepID=A0ABR3G771_9PEZI